MTQSMLPLIILLIIFAQTFAQNDTNEIAGSTAVVQTKPDSTDPFYRDLANLTSTPHRISGSNHAHAAAQYLESRLRKIGVNDVRTIETPVWYAKVKKCELRLNGKTYALTPARNNITIPPSTPLDGITAPLKYVGDGSLDKLGKEGLENSIVVMEYDCENDWREIFKMGAKAILFLGDTLSTPHFPKTVGMPLNLIRLYAPHRVTDSVDLRKNYPEATIVSHIEWTRQVGRSLVAYLKGTEPGFVQDREQDEMVVISANYDTYGDMPFVTRGARGAANCAGVLSAVEFFVRNRPRRDLLFIFADNQKDMHQGTRTVYEAMNRDRKFAQGKMEEYREELIYRRNHLNDIADIQKLTTQEKISDELANLLFVNAEYMWTELNQFLMHLRLERIELKEEGKDFSTEQQARLESMQNEKSKWSDALDALYVNSTAQGIDGNILNRLVGMVRKYLRSRIDELEMSMRIMEQGLALQDKLGNAWIVLHASYNFGDSGPSWGPIPSDNSLTPIMTSKKPNYDIPGNYQRVFRAIRDAVENNNEFPTLLKSSLDDPTQTVQLIPSMYAASNAPAGVFGIYNVALMTHHERYANDGHPADRVSLLNWRKIKSRSLEANRFMYMIANDKNISLQRVIADCSIDPGDGMPRFAGGRSSGFKVVNMVSASLTNDRPATGAVVAIWPKLGEWTQHFYGQSIPAFNRLYMEAVNANGNIQLTGVHKYLYDIQNDKRLWVFATLFNSQGEAVAVPNRKTVNSIKRVDIFPAKGYLFCFPTYGKGDTKQTNVLRASANADFRQDRVLYEATSEHGFGFFYTHRHFSVDQVKLFQEKGIVFLGASKNDPIGKGYPIKKFVYPTPSNRLTAEDLWRLNESRLGILRSKGVIDADLEILHSRAKRSLEKAEETEMQAAKQARYAQSAAVSRVVYNPVKDIMNDLITAIVFLLLLTIPFAFSVERLLICATSVYTRLLGFAVFFFATFMLMYFMHPGFSIASTPVIVFLAFAIILLTTMVIFIMMRKFRTELMSLQGKAQSLHSSDISASGTLIAAINMGMSTMRRRPTRTLLTCITVIMLNFTILCFASFTSSVGVRSVYEGPVSGDINASFFTRNLDYRKLENSVMRLLRGREGEGGLLAGQWWKVEVNQNAERMYDLARVDNSRNILLDGVMGISAAELKRWDQLREILQGDSAGQKYAALENNGIYLPALMREQLSVKIGDSLLLNGYPVTFAGIFDAANMQRIKHLDGRSILPVNFKDETFDTAQTDAEGGSNAVQLDFVRLSANQIAVASDELVQKMGGTLHTVTIYADEGMDTEEEGKRISELTAIPVWTRGKEGVERMIFTKMTGVSGAFALMIPILLGGFIIFGTLLGSITDRQKEIYTFSALGLSPGHVGFLFLAEAAVYAFIGGVGGQLLAQFVALAASFMADIGWIQQPSINFSSSNSIFAILIVMATVLISAIYPAIRASNSANPGVQRSWKMPKPEGGILDMKFPFTVSTYDITGVVSFLSEHFKEHEDAGLGSFAAQDVEISRDGQSGNIQLSASVSLAPFDLGISQDFKLQATPSEIPGIDEVAIKIVHISGADSDWQRSNRVFIRELRKQFLLWRTLTNDVIESYRMNTLEVLGELQPVSDEQQSTSAS
ncbi:MAG: FtsX-like permease family protein [Chitinivibrionales bacterium]|nr:FtsX-like permease family protein [Chitinivibrionales bacterium]